MRFFYLFLIFPIFFSCDKWRSEQKSPEDKFEDNVLPVASQTPTTPPPAATAESEPVFTADSLFRNEDETVHELPLTRVKAIEIEKHPAVSFPISNVSKEVQSHVDHAVWAIHSFFTFEAERQLLTAIDLQKKSHPVLWGLAAFSQLTFSSGSKARAAMYLEKSLDGVKDLPKHEKNFVYAVVSLLNKTQNDVTLRHKDHLAFLHASLKSSKSVDFSREIKAWIALQNWYLLRNRTYDAESFETQEAAALLKEILSEKPNHPALHYQIHLYDEPFQYEKALESAKLSGISTPSSAHQWHMAGHTFAGLGLNKMAGFSFEAGQRQDHSYLARHHLPGSVVHNYPHNLDYWMTVLERGAGLDRLLNLARKYLVLGSNVFPGEDSVRYVLQHLMNVVENYDLWTTVGKEFNDMGVFQPNFILKSESFLQGSMYRFKALLHFRLTGKWDAATEMALQNLIAEQKTNFEKAGLTDIQQDLLAWKKLLITRFEPQIYARVKDNFAVSSDAAKIHAARLSKAPFLAKDEFAQIQNPDSSVHLARLRYALSAGSETCASIDQYWDQVKTKFMATEDFDKKRKTDQEYFDLRSQTALVAQYHEIETALRKCRDYGKEHNSDEFFMVNLPQSLENPSYSWWKKEMGRDLLAPEQANFEPYLPRFSNTSGSWKIVVFTLGDTCPACVLSEINLKKKKSFFQNVTFEVVSPTAEDSSKAAFATIRDATGEIAKRFGVWNEFENKPHHGLFVLRPRDGVAVLSYRLEHAFDRWDDLAREISRLQLLDNSSVMR